MGYTTRMKRILALLPLAVLCAAAQTPPAATPQTPTPAPGRGAGRGGGRGPQYRSHITIYDLRTKATKVLLTSDTRWEAPNWTHDGKYLMANSAGGLWKLAVDGTMPPTPERIKLPDGFSCNNDHGFSFDGKWLAFSASSPASRTSQVYLVSADGGEPKQMTKTGTNYFHGFSPDGKWLSFIGQRPVNGVTKTEIYRVSADGSKEEKLTGTGGYDDGTGHPYSGWPNAADRQHTAPNARPAPRSAHLPQARSRRRRRSLLARAGYIPPLSCARSLQR